jgi:hypothetical protein
MDPFAELDRAIEVATPVQRASLVVALAARLAALGAQLGQPAPDEHLLSVPEACEIARVRRKTLYSWSRNKAWAVRPPGTNTLRVRAGAFERWLAEQRSPAAGPRRRGSVTRPVPDVTGGHGAAAASPERDGQPN